MILDRLKNKLISYVNKEFLFKSIVFMDDLQNQQFLIYKILSKKKNHLNYFKK